MEVFIDNRSTFPLSEDLSAIINKSAEAVLTEEKFRNDVEISVSIVNNEEIKEINKDFRGIDRETDVLSFPLIDFNCDVNDLVPDPCECNILLGDIIISWDKVISQSQEYSHSIERELGFLVVHSMLHLLGYDHENAEEEHEMFSLQENILQNMGLTR